MAVEVLHCRWLMAVTIQNTPQLQLLAQIDAASQMATCKVRGGGPPQTYSTRGIANSGRFIRNSNRCAPLLPAESDAPAVEAQSTSTSLRIHLTGVSAKETAVAHFIRKTQRQHRTDSCRCVSGPPQHLDVCRCNDKNIAAMIKI